MWPSVASELQGGTEFTGVLGPSVPSNMSVLPGVVWIGCMSRAPLWPLSSCHLEPRPCVTSLPFQAQLPCTTAMAWRWCSRYGHGAANMEGDPSSRLARCSKDGGCPLGALQTLLPAPLTQQVDVPCVPSQMRKQSLFQITFLLNMGDSLTRSVKVTEDASVRAFR